MITLNLSPEQIANIKVALLSMAKMANIDERGMMALLALSQEITKQVEEQDNEPE